MSKLSLRKVDRIEFEEALLKGEKGYLKKYRSMYKTYFWWDDPKDPWFMHWAEDRRVGKSLEVEKFGFLTANQMATKYSSMVRDGYSFYLEQ